MIKFKNYLVSVNFSGTKDPICYYEFLASCEDEARSIARRNFVFERDDLKKYTNISPWTISFEIVEV